MTRDEEEDDDVSENRKAFAVAWSPHEESTSARMTAVFFAAKLIHPVGTGAPTIGGFPLILFARPPWTDDELYPLLETVFARKFVRTDGLLPILFLPRGGDPPSDAEAESAVKAIEGALMPEVPRSRELRIVYDETDEHRERRTRRTPRA